MNGTLPEKVTLTDRQKQEIDTWLTEKVPAAEHANWRHHLVQSWDNLVRGKNALRQMPHLPEHARPTKDGLYMDPTSHKLYKVVKKGWDWQISIYSETPALRMEQTTQRVVKKGTWQRLNAWDSRRKYDTLRDVWFMTDEMKVAYQTGICNFCLRPLIDARSVYHNYGPVCADKYGLPWGDLPQGVE